MFHEAEMFHKCFLKDWEAHFRRGRVGLEQVDNLIKHRGALGGMAGEEPACCGDSGCRQSGWNDGER